MQLQKHQVLFAAFCAVVFIMTEFFGSRYFGPLSLRNYAILFSIVLIIIHSSCTNIHSSCTNKSTFNSIRFLILYYLFVILLGVFNELYLDDTGRDLVFARFVPMIIIYYLITTSLSYRKSRIDFIYFLLAVTAIDAIATILQGNGNVLGWEIRSFFSTADLSELIVEEESSIGFSFTSGIAGTVVGNGFLLVSLGLLYWVPYKENKTMISFLVSLSLWLLFLVALFYNQQRMAFYVYLIFSIIIPVLLSHSKIKIFFIAIGLVLAIAMFSDRIKFDQDELGRLSSVTSQNVTDRHKRHNIYYHDFMLDHLITGDRHEWVAIYGSTPHNIIIETLLIGGIGGLILFMLFVVSFGKSVKNAVSKKNEEALLYSIPVIAVFFVSWEHSSGFHTGMTLGAYCLALFELNSAENNKIIEISVHTNK